MAATQRAVLEFLEDRFLFSTNLQSTDLSPTRYFANTAVETVAITSPSPSPAITVTNNSLSTPIGQAFDDSIPAPNITGPTFIITDYGAVGDSSTNNTTAIQNCINAASAAAVSEANSHSALVGAVVEVPAAGGTFLSSSLTIPSNIELQINSGGTLQMLPYGTYNTASPTTPFIYFNNTTNDEITGSGDIDGQGLAWWNAYNANNSVGRPYLVKFNKANTVLVSGVTLSNGPTEHLVFDASTNVVINGISISAPSTSPNTDGIDPAGSNFLIENCTISDGDDDIVMKPQDSFCSNITVTNCIINSGHGISIGGETNDGLNGMEIDHITFNGTVSGIRLKAARGEGGTVQNVVVNDVTMTNVEYPININSYYSDGTIPKSSETADTAQTLTATTPLWENISFSNLTSTDTASNSYCGVIWGLPELPVMGVNFSNVQISAHYGMDLDHVRGITFDSASTLTALGGGADEIETNSGGTPLDAVVTAAGYTDQDIGSPASAGSSLYNPDNGNWTVYGAGTGVAGAADKFNFASAAITGNVAFSAQVSSLAGANAGAAGVMIRESSASNAAFAQAVVTPANGVMFEWRSADGATVQSTTLTGKAPPQYLEVIRVGSNFSAYYSSNGSAWTQIGTAESITMNNSALEGLAVTANASSGVTTAAFAHVNTYTGPTISAAAAANPSPVTGTTTQLTATGASSQNLPLIYTWAATTLPNGVQTPTIAPNGTSAAAQANATFFGAGAYTFKVTITDTDGLSVTSSVSVTVQQTATSISVTPPSPTLVAGSTQQFSATATDQFGAAIASPTFNWSVTGAGNSIDDTGLLTVGSAAGNFTVTAAIGAAQGNDSITVNAPPTVATPAAANPSPVTGTTTQLTVTGASSQGLVLIYNWVAATVPDGVQTPTIAPNGTTAAAQAIATFYGAGNYTFQVTITDTNGLSTTSSVNVTVQQTATVVSVSPPTADVVIGGSQQFTASATDQFGNAIASSAFNWSVTGANNSIDQTGLVSAGATAGDFTVTAAIGSVLGNASIAVDAPPTITSFTVNDGNAQRSMIDSLTIVFSEPVTLADGAITLTGQDKAGDDYVPFSFTLSNPSGDMQTYMLTFTDPSYEAGSLPDGLYLVTVNAASVQDAAGNTMAGGNQTFNFFRLYGDFDGSEGVTFNDLFLLGQVLNQQVPNGDWYWSVDGSAYIEFNDLFAIGQNLNKSISYL